MARATPWAGPCWPTCRRPPDRRLRPRRGQQQDPQRHRDRPRQRGREAGPPAPVRPHSPFAQALPCSGCKLRGEPEQPLRERGSAREAPGNRALRPLPQPGGDRGPPGHPLARPRRHSPAGPLLPPEVPPQRGARHLPWDERPFHLVVLDEASQVNVPEALLACAFVDPDGQALVVGDHRQMPPIVAVSWNEEARRTVVDSEVYRSVFDFLRARPFRPRRPGPASASPPAWPRSWRRWSTARTASPTPRRQERSRPPHRRPLRGRRAGPGHPVVVVEHEDERLPAGQPGGTGADHAHPAHLHRAPRPGRRHRDRVVVPHRAQRALLRARFPALAAANAIDTVERFQGGERDVIVVSATASDPDYILSEADFLLNPNRLNVALSRPRRKLIVIASGTCCACSPPTPTSSSRPPSGSACATPSPAPLWAGPRAGTAVRVFGASAGTSCSEALARHEGRLCATSARTGRPRSTWQDRGRAAGRPLQRGPGPHLDLRAGPAGRPHGPGYLFVLGETPVARSGPLRTRWRLHPGGAATPAPVLRGAGEGRAPDPGSPPWPWWLTPCASPPPPPQQVPAQGVLLGRPADHCRRAPTKRGSSDAERRPAQTRTLRAACRPTVPQASHEMMGGRRVLHSVEVLKPARRGKAAQLPRRPLPGAAPALPAPGKAAA